MNIPWDQPLLILAAIFVAVLGVGRLARVITYDEYPPSVWARIQWDRLTKDGPWSKLAHCHWCLGPYLMAACLLWGALSSLHWSWFGFWGWLALSYLSGIVTARDEPQ